MVPNAARWFLLFPLLLSIACGGGESTGSAPSPTAMPPAAKGDQGPVELTDSLMQQYIDVVKELKRAGAAGQAALLTSYGWNMERWTTVSAAVASGVAAAGKAQLGQASAEAAKQLDAQIQAAEQRLAKADGDQQAAMQQQVDALRAARKGLVQQTEGVTEVDRRNAEVLQRWLPKLSALDGK